MRWGRRNWAEKPPRPAVRRLTADEQEKMWATMARAVSRSPVLTAFRVEARCLRGRFYIERPTATGCETWGRITPLADTLLLEVEGRSSNWFEIAKGSEVKLIKAIANDAVGTFHGLGSLEKSLVAAGQGLTRLPVSAAGKSRFSYAGGQRCTAQEALFHYFGLPVEVIAQPRQWYARHRTPYIVEYSADRTKSLVRFSATSLSGENFGGTCLYHSHDGEWAAFTIKPSDSQSIAAAERWIVKRNWRPWC